MIEVDKSISWLQVSLPKGGGIKGEGLISKGKEIGEEETKFVTQLIFHLVSGSLAGALW